MFTRFTFLLTTYRTASLRLEITLDVKLLIPKPVHGNPVPHLFHLLPHVGIALLDEGLDLGLLVAVDGGVVPVAETAGSLLVQRLVRMSRRRRKTYM